jgi:hypothetical protein
MIGAMDPTVLETMEFVAQAILKRPPAYFAARGIAFREGLDDLNEYQIAELAVDNVPFALMRHEGTPPDETAVYLPDSIPVGDLPNVIGRILAEFDLPQAAVSWRRQSADTPS